MGLEIYHQEASTRPGRTGWNFFEVNGIGSTPLTYFTFLEHMQCFHLSLARFRTGFQFSPLSPTLGNFWTCLRENWHVLGHSVSHGHLLLDLRFWLGQ